MWLLPIYRWVVYICFQTSNALDGPSNPGQSFCFFPVVLLTLDSWGLFVVKKISEKKYISKIAKWSPCPNRKGNWWRFQKRKKKRDHQNKLDFSVRARIRPQVAFRERNAIIATRFSFSAWLWTNTATKNGKTNKQKQRGKGGSFFQKNTEWKSHFQVLTETDRIW